MMWLSQASCFVAHRDSRDERRKTRDQTVCFVIVLRLSSLFRRLHRPPQAHLERRIADALFRDDPRQIAMRGHVEGRVVDRHAIGRDLLVADVGDLASAALLDRDQVAVGQREVDGRRGDDGVARDAVLPRDHRQLVRADLVRHIAVRRHAIRAEEHQVDPAEPHQHPRGVVGDQGHRDAVAHQLPGGQPSALEPRPRLVHPDVDLLARLDCRTDDAQRGAVIHRRQRAGVAMGQDVRPIAARSPRRTRPCAG